MSVKGLLAILPYIREGRIGLESISKDSGLDMGSIAGPLRILERAGACRLIGSEVEFHRGSRIMAIEALVGMGCGIEDILKALGWREFEEFVCHVLDLNGYECFPDLRLKVPRIQIDVFARRGGLGLVIECKRWRRDAGPATFSRLAGDQARRAEALARSGREEVKGLDRLLPVVIAIYTGGLRVVGGIPIVPVNRIRSFLLELPGYLDTLRLIPVRMP